MTDTLYNRAEAAQRAVADDFNVPSSCQLTTRTWIGAPSAGDQNNDGDADAVDGWMSEPFSARHNGDRNPPRGTPVAWSGGTHGFGHRALSLGKGKDGRVMIRSTDAGGSGRVATVDLGWVERNWGLHYLGWSSTMTGQTIPRVADDAPDPKPRPRGHLSRGARVDLAIHRLKLAARRAKPGTARRRFLDRAVRILLRVNASKKSRRRPA